MQRWEDAKRAKLVELRTRLAASRSADPFAAWPRDERVAFTAAVAKDSQVKYSRGSRPSETFLRGPTRADNPSLALAKLLTEASKSAEVPLPPGTLTDLASSGLVDDFEAMVSVR